MANFTGDSLIGDSLTGDSLMPSGAPFWPGFGFSTISTTGATSTISLATTGGFQSLFAHGLFRLEATTGTEDLFSYGLSLTLVGFVDKTDGFEPQSKQ